MNAAIERLAAELMNLPTDEWDRLDELRSARQNSDAAGQQNEIEIDATAKVGAGETVIDAPSQVSVRSRNQT